MGIIGYRKGLDKNTREVWVSDKEDLYILFLINAGNVLWRLFRGERTMV